MGRRRPPLIFFLRFTPFGFPGQHHLSLDACSCVAVCVECKNVSWRSDRICLLSVGCVSVCGVGVGGGVGSRG